MVVMQQRRNWFSHKTSAR